MSIAQLHKQKSSKARVQKRKWIIRSKKTSGKLLILWMDLQNMLVHENTLLFFVFILPDVSAKIAEAKALIPPKREFLTLTAVSAASWPPTWIMFLISRRINMEANELTRLLEALPRLSFRLNFMIDGTRGVWDLHRSPPHEPGVIDPFFYFLIAEVFLHQIYRAAKI